MNFETKKLSVGLYFVATPIGTARDITLRALDILASADVIAAEDTRTARRLMDIHAIPLGDRPLIAYHDHNGAQARPRLLRYLEEGKSVAYASEAGTPLVADPGYGLAQAVIEQGGAVTSAPGPSAVIAALTIAGLPTDQFHFAGFSPNSSKARQNFIQSLAKIEATLVFYESPKRIAAALNDLSKFLGPERKAAVCREITKKFEEVARGTLSELAAEFSERNVKGEIVVVVDGMGDEAVEGQSIEDALKNAMESHSIKDSATIVAQALNVPRREVYQTALAMNKDKVD
ncbi:16S rRNA (cytidine(1402)-2'-O)-methyltransferase [Falsihalocynthiibacter sp. SS001]|uniref:16S rRNA (cytidine(1402)-2'-O)-methyltransferase n=1 Tax=Falsihalocynthiibacter sp. SS001 TaxID=3349698 RepID=UPI0036D44067